MAAALEGRVAFITGVARGQGRAHALRLAREGVHIIGADICADIPSMDYSCATPEDLAETQRMVESAGGRMVASVADVRDSAALNNAFRRGFAEFGRVDMILANAGHIRLGDEVDPVREWQDTIDIILTGTFNTVRAALPAMIDGDRGGSIVITSSTSGLRGTGSNLASAQAYTAAKRGQVGYMQVLANDLAKHWIRVNTIHPTGVVSGMTMNPVMQQRMAELDSNIASMQNALPIPILQPEDIANAVAFLVSDEAKFITGIQWPLDAGFAVRV